MHGILPTKLRLHEMKQIISPLCPFCNVLEDNIHMFLKCTFWKFLKLKKYICIGYHLNGNLMQINSCKLNFV